MPSFEKMEKYSLIERMARRKPPKLALTPGSGYWIEVTEEAIWTLP